MYILAAISFPFNFGLTLMRIFLFFLLLCDLFAVYINYFLFVMLFSPHNFLVFIFLSALFLFNCFFADFLINPPKYIIRDSNASKPHISKMHNVQETQKIVSNQTRTRLLATSIFAIFIDFAFEV